MSSPTEFVKTYGNTCGTTLGLPFGTNVLNVATANAFRNLSNYFEGIAVGARGFNGYVVKGGVQASGTVTFSSIAAADTVTINGVIFTASASPTTNIQFLVTGGDTVAAAALAAKINASTAPNKIVNVVSATSALGVITLTFLETGQIGNLGTLAISAHGSVSGINFTGGTDGTVTALRKGL
jgi:hypothetical protein